MKDIFKTISDSLSGLPDVQPGRMMSSPAITYKGKAFAFYHESRMCFKLGDPRILQARNMPVELLYPFKSKGPLKSWFLVPAEHCVECSELAGTALKCMI